MNFWNVTNTVWHSNYFDWWMSNVVEWTFYSVELNYSLQVKILISLICSWIWWYRSFLIGLIQISWIWFRSFSIHTDTNIWHLVIDSHSENVFLLQFSPSSPKTGLCREKRTSFSVKVEFTFFSYITSVFFLQNIRRAYYEIASTFILSKIFSFLDS